MSKRRNDKIVEKRIERKEQKIEILKREAKARAKRLGDKADPNYKLNLPK